jgi:hypothetical protein
MTNIPRSEGRDPVIIGVIPEKHSSPMRSITLPYGGISPPIVAMLYLPKLDALKKAITTENCSKKRKRDVSK